jgi:3D (Asp-Asp-Asp) domain-containing protein
MLLFDFLPAQTRRTGGTRTFEATAFAHRSATASGVKSQRGVVAADPRLLPLGTEIQVRNAGRYSGIYVVADTGPKIQGRRIDIFIPNPQRAKSFGKKTVEVKVRRWGAAPGAPTAP